MLGVVLIKESRDTSALLGIVIIVGDYGHQ